MIIKKRKPLVDRFWSRVKKSEGCWIWTGGVHGGGLRASEKPRHMKYGAMRVGKKKMNAHRFSYEQIKGPIPDGLVLDHLCRNRLCVNPDHLEPVTWQENLRRGDPHMGIINKMRTHCNHGHEFTVENTYLRNGKYRRCKECKIQQSRNRYKSNPEYWVEYRRKNQD